MSDEPHDEYDVAVVVFCRTTGVDEADAENGAQLAVRNAIAGGKRVARVPMVIPLPEYLIERGFTDPVQVADVSGLRYVGGQVIRLQATAEPYQNAGMERPRKRQQ